MRLRRRIVRRIHRLLVRWGFLKHPYGREYVRDQYGIFGGRKDEHE